MPDHPLLPLADSPLDIYFVAIGGTGMAPLACLLKGRGHQVRGSDGPLYPPMSTLLEQAGIEPLVGFRPENLETRPDLVIIGNAVPRDNPEALEVERLGIPRISMPQALARFFLAASRPLVIAGTHGKTTTTSLAAWVWSDCGKDPGYLIGGVPRNFEQSFHDGRDDRFIIEGDEYNASYFDRGPKFLHYLAQTVALTSVEYDHADLYPNPETLLSAYAKLVRSLPEDGLLIACGDAPDVRVVAGDANCRVVFYGLEDFNDLHPDGEIEHSPAGSRFHILDPEEGRIRVDLPMSGEHNLCNALAVWAAARNDGIAGAQIAAALARFRGVKRRMDELGSAAGITVVEDFAHHPTAAGKTLEAMRFRYPGKRLVVAFEPRTLTAGRSFLTDAYLKALSTADVVFLAPIFHAGRLAAEDRLDPDALISDLIARGVEATYCDDGEIFTPLLARIQEGDVLVTMSAGSFGLLPHRVLQALDRL